jgi:peptidoglycan/xylan/chitin deacetylase (PgdA/CDA1 family)
MAEFNLKMIKIFFVVVIAMLILAMTSGMNILRNTKFFDWQELKMEMDFAKYKKALAAETGDTSNQDSVDIRYAESVPVLLYHGVVAGKDWKNDETNISLADFKEQMFSLKRAGYRTVSLSEFHDFMKNGKKLPDKSFLLTFDDGRKDSYYPVDPILKALDYRAVMFAITSRSIEPGSSGDSFYLSLSELNDMKKSGRWEIESHGDFDHDWKKISEDGKEGHFLSNRLWLTSQNRIETEDEARKRIIGDLASSKSKIENRLGEKVLAFAYPFNDYGQDSENFPESGNFIRENIGNIFPLTFVQIDNDEMAGNYPDPNQLFIKRLDVNSNVSAKNLLEILNQNKDKNLPYSDTFWNNNGWISRWGMEKVWGDLAIGDESGEKTGNLTVLLGAQKWKDYSFRASLEVDQGNSVSQVVRYQDDDNYLTCNFSLSGVSIAEKNEGNERVIAELNENQIFSTGVEIQIETAVQGDQVSCFLNGIKKIEARTSGKMTSGGIGFSIWDDLPQNSLIRVKKIEVHS